MADDSDAALEERVARIHTELQATEERPIERGASRWIGEAEAVADDAAELCSTDGSEDVVRERVGHVADLLGNVDGTGDETADEHVETARELAERVAGDQ